MDLESVLVYKHAKRKKKKRTWSIPSPLGRKSLDKNPYIFTISKRQITMLRVGRIASSKFMVCAEINTETINAYTNMADSGSSYVYLYNPPINFRVILLATLRHVV